MKTVSDYLIERLEREKISHVFLLPGGGCMYLVDSLARSKSIEKVPMLHEQAVGIAAEAFAQFNNTLGACLVTTGPGATNAITPCAAAWTDSTPVLFISGQVKTADSAESTGLRQKGFQEIPITEIVKSITKKSVRITNPNEVPEVVEELIALAKSGRPGPVWLDIPLDIQNMKIAEINLMKAKNIHVQVSDSSLVSQILREWSLSSRPLILAGNGVRIAGAGSSLEKLVHQTNTPVLLTWKALDFLDETDPLNAGRPGAIAQRWSNFAQQNCDFLLVIGARLDLGQIAYRPDNFAPSAKIFYCDIDPSEASKFQEARIISIVSDAQNLITALIEQIGELTGAENRSAWIEKIHEWKSRFPIIQEKHLNPKDGVNVYALLDKLSDKLKNDDVFIPGSSGACSEVAMQSFKVKKGQRVLNSEALGPMGFGIAAPIGGCLASGKRRTIGLDGDGGFLMNVQELSTLKIQDLPIKIFVLNNNGYGSIKSSQDNYFNGRRLGTDPSSGLGMPSIKGVVEGFGLRYSRIENNAVLDEMLTRILGDDIPEIIEVIVDSNQTTEPRTTTTVDESGRLLTERMEILSPKISAEELVEIMSISKPIS